MRLSRLALVLCLLCASLARAQGKSNVRYVDPGPQAADLVTQVNQLYAACNYFCEVHIPAGNYKVAAGTILMHHSTQSLTGDGPGLTRIVYAGPNFLDWRLDAATYDFNGAGVVSGFSVTCTSLAAKCITAGSIIGALFENLAVYGPGGIVNQSPAGSSEAFAFQNTYNWMERWTMRHILIGGFDVNLHFMNPAGGTPSFGYGEVDGINTNQGGGTRGIVIDPSAFVYNFTGWKYTFNLGFNRPGATNLIFDVHGAFRGTGLEITGENQNVPYVFAHLTCGGNMQANGAYRVYGQPGIIVDPCPGQPITNGLPPFWTGPLMNPTGLTAGAGTVANWNNSGQTYAVLPTAMGGVDYPTGAMTGYMFGTTDGASSPLLTFDARTSLCLQTHNGYAPINNITPVWCADGAGDSDQPGVVRAGAFAVHGVKGFSGTVDTAKCTPVFHIDGGIITSVTCSGH